MGTYDLTGSKAYNAELKKILPGAVHHNFKDFSRAEPIRFHRGSGSRIWDIDGNEYLDLSCQFGAMILGHGDSEFTAALHSQVDRLINTTSADLELGVAEAVQDCCAGMEQLRFGVTGTEAVLNALRLARAHTGRRKFVRFEGHYHGNADPIMGGRAGAGARPEQFAGDPFDTGGRDFAIVAEHSYLLPWNDAAALEAILADETNDIAAVLMEPACINGGGIVADPGFLCAARELCDRFGIVLLFDEIITGFRQSFGAPSWSGVTPDLRVLGKALGNGVPISVFGGRREIMRHIERRKVVHGGTFNGHPLGLAAAKATLSVLNTAGDSSYAGMVVMAAKIRTLISDYAARHGIDLHFRGTDKITILHVGLPPESVHEYRQIDRMISTSIVVGALARYGVLACPPSRLYLNMSFKAADLAFLESRLDDAMADARALLDKAQRR
jgi:glutamate-1-semialdehyde 2,1-aminomutase